MSKKRIHGPSLYYATDKNVFDALNLHKIDTSTVIKLFQRRNILVSKKTQREELAKYFSRLSHDYYDHQNIAARLGVISRRERITSMDVIGTGETDDLHHAMSQLKQEVENQGDVIQVTRNGDNISIHIQYSEIDYKRSEFSQVQVRDGTIEFVKSEDGFIIRNTQNEYLNDLRDSLLSKIEKISQSPLTKVTVSLFGIPSSKLRSKFFHELANSLPGFKRKDVTDVYVFKAKPATEDNDDQSPDPDTHIERVFLRGNGVSRSQLLNDLLDEENYYIIKMGWTTAEIMNNGDVYDIEAAFTDPADCALFSFILSGVYPREDGKISSRRRPPTTNEIDKISRVIETKARELVVALQTEYSNLSTGDE